MKVGGNASIVRVGLDSLTDLGSQPSKRNLPLVNTGKRLKFTSGPKNQTNQTILTEATFYPAEYLEIAPLNILKRSLPQNFTRVMVDTAARRPHVNRSLITDEGLRLSSA